MFHKPSSSTQGGKKDAPLRKSDRRKLRDRVLETLFTDDAPPDNSEWINNAEKLIDDALVGGGEVLSRKLRLDGRNVTLFLRTASTAAIASDSREVVDLMTSFPVTWPYQTLQPILIEYEDADRKLHLIPLLPLLATLPPPLPSTALGSLASTDENPNANETLHKRYKIPNIQIHSAVSKFICRGAHLMKSGIRSFPPPWTLRQSKGLVSVSVVGNPQILAVGFVEHTLFREYCYKKHESWELTANTLVGPETKGIGVEIVSCYGDDLWKTAVPAKIPESAVTSPFGGGFDDGHYGNVGFLEGRFVVPIMSAADGSSDDEEDDAVETLADGDAQDAAASMEQMKVSDQNEETQPTSNPDANDAPQDDATIEPDHNAILEAAFYTSLLQILASKTPLPVPISTYSAKHLMAAVPQSGPRLDMKQTRHKKIGPFLQEMESAGIIKIGASKDKKDKCAFLTGIEKSHPELLSFKRQWKKEMEESGQSATMGGSIKKKLAVVDLCIVPRHISDGMKLSEDDVKAMNAKTEERRGTGYLTKTECRAIIENYIETEGLADPKCKGKIFINGPLCDALYRPSKKDKTTEDTSYPTTVTRKELIDKWIAKMDLAHALVQMPGSKILNLARGEPKPVDIEVEFRQGNKKKFLTRIRGMEEYGIDAELLCNDVSTRFACSGSVETNPVGRAALKKARAELVFQGTRLTLFDEVFTSLLVHTFDYRLLYFHLKVIYQKNLQHC